MKVAVVLNGEPFSRRITEDIIICADGGYNILPKEYTADYLVGDLDSITVEYKGVKTILFPAKKNQTDGELAIAKAASLKAEFIALYGAMGGRADHVYGNYSLLKLASSLGIDAKICADNCDIYYKNSSFKLKTEPKDIISLLSFGSDCLINSAHNLQYPLDNLLLTKDNAGRGISNIATDRLVEVDIAHGDLLVFHNF